MASESDQEGQFPPKLDQQATTAEDQLGEAVTAPADADGERTRESTLAPIAEAFTAGARIGRFVVLEELGRGGMGVVLTAYDPMLDRRVAVKVVKSHARGSDAIAEVNARMLREARGMARLAHPNVLTVLDVGVVDDGVFIAMEYAAGGNLRSWQSDRSHRWREVLARYCDAGRGLAAAHRAGLVHRDFKPDNVLLHADGRVCVADFGLVGTRHDATNSTTQVPVAGVAPEALQTVTQTGALLGTPAYMAPEQHQAERVGAHADQFAFAVSLWEALYGRRPFAGRTYAELALNVTSGAIEAPPRDIDVPSRIRTTLERALSADPAARFSSMNELIAVLGRDATTGTRWRMPVVIGSLGIAVIALCALYLLEGRHPASNEVTKCAAGRDRVETVWGQEQRAAAERAAAALAPGSLDTLFRHLDDFRASWITSYKQACDATHRRGDQSQQVLDLRMRCLDRRLRERSSLISTFIADPSVTRLHTVLSTVVRLPPVSSCDDVDALAASVPLPEDPVVRQRVQELSDLLDSVVALQNARELPAALARLDEAASEFEAIEYLPVRARYFHVRGVTHQLMYEAASAVRDQEEAARLAAEGRDDLLLAQVWLSLTYIHGLQLRDHAAAKLLDPVADLAIRRAQVPERIKQSLYARLYSLRGSQLDQAGSLSEARENFQLALDAMRLGGLDRNMDFALTESYLASVEARLGLVDVADRRFERARKMLTETLGPAHPESITVIGRQAHAAYSHGRLAEAERLMREEFESYRTIYGDDDLRTRTALGNLGAALAMRGKHGEALDIFAAQVSAFEARADRGVELAQSLQNLGSEMYELRRWSDAIARLSDAERLYVSTLGTTHLRTAQASAELGHALFLAGNITAAESHLRAACRTLDKSEGAIVESAMCQYYLGKVLHARGRTSDAIRIEAEVVAKLDSRLGASNWFAAYPLTVLARLYREKGLPLESIAAAERAVALRIRFDIAPEKLAESRFELARAQAAGGREEEANRTALQSLADYGRADKEAREAIVEIERWLKRRGQSLP
ncbi:MAG: protein kinase [Deltaproteobacteria bacterium]|nr:protein kinase [Kofleriaceae bacterium]